MKKIVTLVGFLLPLISVVPAFGQSPMVSSTEPTPGIIVRTHVLVKVPDATLVQAEEVASEILGRVGVDVVWINCDFAVPRESWEPGCSRPHTSLDFVLNVVDHIQGLSPKLSEIAMGVAAVPPPGGLGDWAYIGVRQAQAVAQISGVPLETVLGLGAAHELGHLLLGENAHSATGLMKARWGNNELNLSSHGHLMFLSEQGNRIRANLLTRQKKISNSTIAVKTGDSTGDGPPPNAECSSCSSMATILVVGSY